MVYNRVLDELIYRFNGYWAAKDVDLDMATVSVNRSLYRAKGGQSIYQDPKTAKGRRLVALTPSSALLLRALWERQEVDGLLQGYAVNGDSPVFRYRDGSPSSPLGLPTPLRGSPAELD